jgi:ribose transport system ATP-binding protein
MVEIAAGLARQCDVLILDEPTAALTGAEIERLFAQVAALKAAGTGILYISHRLEEIRRIADRVSVLRDGRLVVTRAASDCAIPDLVRWMVGRDLEPAKARRAHPPGAVALEVRGLRCPPAVQEVSLTVRCGEILGLAGLMGSGRTETLRAIYGADRPAAGEIRLHGSAPVRFRSPRDAVRHGLALLTEDRKAQGLLLPLAVRVNLTLAALRAVTGAAGWIRRTAESELARRWMQRLSIRCRSEEQPVAELSGGNQQKVVLARWLCRDCDVLLFDEPTRGVDVGARFEIYRWLDELAARGKALVVVSSDLPELMMLCDRIAVLSAGRLVATFARGEWTEDRLLTAALSGHLVARN